jgi:hypothetical protein
MVFFTKESTHDSPLLLGQQQKRIKNLFPCKNCSSLVDLFINSFGSCSRLVSFFSSTRRELVHPRGLSEKNMGAQDFGCVQCAQVIRQTDAAHTSVDPSKKGEEKKMMMMRRRSCSRK